MGIDGRVVITDFGIARAMQGSEGTPLAGEFVGTPEYMSPEQAEGAAIDIRTDIYSLGVVLFELLTGVLPFTGNSPLSIAAARLLKPPPDPRRRRPDLPEAVAQVVLRCLSRQPQDRYASASALATALAVAVHASAVSAGSDVPLSVRSPTGPLPVEAAGPRLSLSLPLLPAADASIKTVAVLPFRNQGHAEDEYLADGLTEDLTDALSMVQGLRVRSRGAVMSLSDNPRDARALGRELGVQLLFEGTLRRQGESLRISVRLINLEDGFQIWAQRFERPAADALQISDEVARAVAAALQENGVQAGPQRRVLSDAQAVDLYLRGRALFQRGDRSSSFESVELLERALALRPDDPTLLTSYAQARSRLWFFGGEGSGELARAAAECAVAAAPERGEPYLALASVHFSLVDPVATVVALRQALHRSPAFADAHDLLGRVLIESGLHAAGLRHLEYALQADPSMARTLVDRARAHALLGDWTEAERLLADPRLAAPGLLELQLIVQIRLLSWQRDRKRAQAMLQRPEFASGRSPQLEPFLRLVAGQTGPDPTLLIRNGVGSEQSSPRARSFYHQIVCENYLLVENTDAALQSLGRAVDAGLFDVLWIEGCPLLAPLRLDPRVRGLRKIVADRATAVHNALR